MQERSELRFGKDDELAACVESWHGAGAEIRLQWPGRHLAILLPRAIAADVRGGLAEALGLTVQQPQELAAALCEAVGAVYEAREEWVVMREGDPETEQPYPEQEIQDAEDAFWARLMELLDAYESLTMAKALVPAADQAVTP